MKFKIRPKKENLPTFLTLFNLICGFLAIISIFDRRYLLSSSMILLAMIFDLLDGMLARKLGVASNLGSELDSLADAVSFVVAPALLVYFNYFTTLRAGIIVALFIVIFGVLRLAKFNITESKDYFVGMPTSYFAAITIGLIMGGFVLREEITAIMFFILSYLMISPMKYPNFKSKKTMRYKIVGMVMLAFLSVALILNLNMLAIIIVEYSLLWALILLPILFDKTFVLKRPLIVFDVGLLLLTVAFYTNQKFLMVLPLIYSAVASPLIEMSLKQKRWFRWR